MDIKKVILSTYIIPAIIFEQFLLLNMIKKFDFRDTFKNQNLNTLD